MNVISELDDKLPVASAHALVLMLSGCSMSTRHWLMETIFRSMPRHSQLEIIALLTKETCTL